MLDTIDAKIKRTKYIIININIFKKYLEIVSAFKNMILFDFSLYNLLIPEDKIELAYKAKNIMKNEEIKVKMDKILLFVIFIVETIINSTMSNIKVINEKINALLN
ncbi:hypothetical protein [Clostridium ihumii]|uniref:hypothetical protein n=1 Tax=Clostridium ihumii TaxID=1470356 RepID=UPI003D358CFC